MSQEGVKKIPRYSPEGTLSYRVVDLRPLRRLNEFRSQLELPPSQNLMSSHYTHYGSVQTLNLEGNPGTVSTVEHANPVEDEEEDKEEDEDEDEEEEEEEVVVPGNSLAYQGNTQLSENVSAPIPEMENCRLWITGLPPDCTVNQLLRYIRGVGPIYACHISQPKVSGPEVWKTATASLTFFTAEAANLFLQRSATNRFTVSRYVTRIARHKIRTRSITVAGQSRVLKIRGNPKFVTPEYMRDSFKRWNIKYDTDYMSFTPGEKGRPNELIWAFGSFRAQALAVYTHLWTEHVQCGHLMVRYDRDPCSL
ncbi:hypothetical protein GGS21DRAFT_549133 [Xylaria nigripes]|nr:hypothetical protein GGS21DRAFT_549133 [Xylaria nigripes]